MFLSTDQSRLILGKMEMITEKSWTPNTHNQHCLPEMSKVEARVGGLNNEDYTFNCTWK